MATKPKAKPKTFKVTIEGIPPESPYCDYKEALAQAHKQAQGSGFLDLIKVKTHRPTRPFMPARPYKGRTESGQPKPKGFRREFIFSVHPNAV